MEFWIPKHFEAFKWKNIPEQQESAVSTLKSLDDKILDSIKKAEKNTQKSHLYANCLKEKGILSKEEALDQLNKFSCWTESNFQILANQLDLYSFTAENFKVITEIIRDINSIYFGALSHPRGYVPSRAENLIEQLILIDIFLTPETKKTIHLWRDKHFDVIVPLVNKYRDKYYHTTSFSEGREADLDQIISSILTTNSELDKGYMSSYYEMNGDLFPWGLYSNHGEANTVEAKATVPETKKAETTPEEVKVRVSESMKKVFENFVGPADWEGDHAPFTEKYVDLFEDEPAPVRSKIRIEAEKAAYRVAATQLTKVSRGAIISVLPENQKGIENFLKSEIGASLLSMVNGLALTYGMKENERAQRLGKEFRIASMAGAGNFVIDEVMGMIGDVMTSSLDEAEKSVEESPDIIVVSEPLVEETVEAEEEKKSKA
jgi:hypothetical protein